MRNLLRFIRTRSHPFLTLVCTRVAEPESGLGSAKKSESSTLAIQLQTRTQNILDRSAPI